MRAALPDFIEHIYFKRHGRERPEVVTPITERGRRAHRTNPRRALIADAQGDAASATEDSP